MNEIRKNHEQEEVLAQGKFKMPLALIIIYGFFVGLGVLFLIIGITSTKTIEEEIYYSYSESYTYSYTYTDYFSLTMGLMFLLIATPLFVLHYLSIKKCCCQITNKAIKGVSVVFLIKKAYTYRLDQIDNVEIGSIFGIHSLNLNFSQGAIGAPARVMYRSGAGLLGGANVFRVSCLENANELFGQLTQLLESVKNEKDLMVDIEAKKIEAEERKARAFEAMAENIGGGSPVQHSDYITQLKELNSLLEAGIITQEEFAAKKKNLLDI